MSVLNLAGVSSTGCGQTFSLLAVEDEERRIENLAGSRWLNESHRFFGDGFSFAGDYFGSFCGLRFCPSCGKKLFQLTGLHGIDAAKYVGQIGNWVDSDSFCGSHKGKMNCRGFASLVRPDEKGVLPHQYEVFDGSFACIVIQIDVGVFQKSGERQPVLERIVCCIANRIFGWQHPLHFKQDRLTSSPS